jgi:hypothetical protein
MPSNVSVSKNYNSGNCIIGLVEAYIKRVSMKPIEAKEHDRSVQNDECIRSASEVVM